MSLKIYVCTNFLGHYPVGTAAVIVANNRLHAEDMLRQTLKQRGLKQDDHVLTLTRIDTLHKNITILHDGDY